MARGDGLTAFLQGFSQTFDEKGGFDKLSSYAAKNIADGEYYNPQDDPQYYKELQRAKELGTEVAKNNFVDKYSQYVDTGDTRPEIAFGFEKPEQPTYMGMAEDAARKAILGLAQQGKDVSQFVEGYNKAFGNRLDTNFVNTFKPEEQTGFTNEQLYSSNQLRKLSDEEVQQLKNEGYNISQLQNNPGWYSVKSPLIEKDEGLQAGDYENIYNIAQNMLNDGDVTDSEMNVWNNLGYPGNPEDYIPEQKTQINFGDNPIATIASRIALGANADKLINTYNNQTPNAMNITSDMINNYIQQNQPKQGNMVDLGIITGDENLQGQKMTIDAASQYMDLMNKIRKYKEGNLPDNEYTVDISKITGNQNHTNVPINEAEKIVSLYNTMNSNNTQTLGIEDIVGTTQDGQIVYGTDKGGYITRDKNGNLSVFTGQLAGKENLGNNDVNFEVPGSWEPLGVDKWANTNRQVWLDDGNFLRYPDGSYVTDQEENYWTWNSQDGEYQTENPDTDLNIPAFQKDSNDDVGFGKNLLRSIVPGGDPGWWGNDNQNTTKENFNTMPEQGPMNKNNTKKSQQTQPTNEQGTKQNYNPLDVIDKLKDTYEKETGNAISDKELANKLVNLNDKSKQKIVNTYGIPIYSLAAILRYSQ